MAKPNSHYEFVQFIGEYRIIIKSFIYGPLAKSKTKVMQVAFKSNKQTVYHTRFKKGSEVARLKALNKCKEVIEELQAFDKVFPVKA